MNLEEFRKLTGNNALTEEDLAIVVPIYLELDFDKADFCKLIKAIGIEKWTNNLAGKRWVSISKGCDMLAAKRQYLANKAKLNNLRNEISEMESEIDYLEEAIANYEEYTK